MRGGLDLGGTKIQAVVTDGEAQVLGQARRETPQRGGPEAVVLELAETLREALDDARVEPMGLAAVGVGAPGSGGSGASPTNTAPRSSDGQLSTFVGCGLPRKSAFNTAIRASSHPIRLIAKPTTGRPAPRSAAPAARSANGPSPKASHRASSIIVSTRAMAPP